jgi:hypothetical protein
MSRFQPIGMKNEIQMSKLKGQTNFECQRLNDEDEQGSGARGQ